MLMDKKKKLLIIGGAAAGTALIALVIVSIALANRPGALVARSISNTLNDAKRIDAVAIAKDVANGGSIAASANLGKFAKDDVTVQAKYYSNVKDLKGALVVTMNEDDESILDAKVMFSEDKIAMSAPELFDGTYGMNLKNLSKNLPGSIFDPDEETKYSFDEDVYDYLMEFRNTAKSNKTLAKDIAAMSSKYQSLLFKKIMKYGDVTKTSKKIKAGGENISCTVITLSVDEDALALIAQDMIDYANADKDLEELITRIASNAGAMRDPESVIDEFYDMLDETEDSIDDLEDEDIDMEISFYVTKSGRRLAQVDAELEVDGEGYEASLVLGKDISKAKEMSLEIKEKDSKDSFSIKYEVAENSSKAFEAKVKFTETNGRREPDTNLIKIGWDKKKGDFELKYTDEYDDGFTIKGQLTQKGDKTTFLLTNIKEDGEPVENIKSLGLTVTLDRHDPTPKVPGRFTEIITLDERDYKHFSEDIEDGIEDISNEYFEW